MPYVMISHKVADYGKWKRGVKAHAALRKAAKLVQRGGKKRVALGFSVQRPDPAQPKRLRVTPDRPLPIHSAFTFEIAASLTSEEGKLPAAAGLWWLSLPVLALAAWLYFRDGRMRRPRRGARAAA